DHKTRQERGAAEKAGFFADHGVDKIRVRFRKEEHLLLSFHEPDANDTAGTDSNLRLPLLVAGVARRSRLFSVLQDMFTRVQFCEEMMLRIDEIDRPAEPVWLHRDKHQAEEKPQGAGC